jgi:hypothetical protein
MSNQKWVLALMAGIFLGILIIGVPLTAWYLAEGRQASARSTSTPAAPVLNLSTSTPVLAHPSATEPAAAPSTSTAFPTQTATPTASPLPTNTATAFPSLTPLPTAIPTQTPVPIPCNAAVFVKDVSVPPGTWFAPGDGFVKTWSLKNVGTCTWSTSYDLVFVNGTAMTKKNLVVPLTKSIRPGETVEISVKLSAPEKPGGYSGGWMLQGTDGKNFGIGPTANQAFTVEIKVLNVNPAAHYDFSLKMCSAVWRNSHQDRLNCPGLITDTRGFVVLLENPKMEHRTENEPALWVHPDGRENGWISGTFPSYRVQAGDHFKAWVGCLAENKGCKVTFELRYRIGDNETKTLGSWPEVMDGEVTLIDLDLTALEGKDVTFILFMQVNNSKTDQANGFWFAPRIEK